MADAMGRPPAYIFVVRHGKRLDAADRQWHLSSPTPYDPPLTYGGWMQSRTVGARIADILREREEDAQADASFAAAVADANESANDGHAQQQPPPQQKARKKKRYRVVIHSSPFLRCVQTSVAISAGLASHPYPSIPASANTAGAASPEARALGASHQPSPASSPVLSHSQLAVSSPGAEAPRNLPKSVLRLDSFLGEWLSPDYFEHITPPPRSMLMLATAKAELLRRENYNEYPAFHARHHPHPTVGGHLWNAGGGAAAGSAIASPGLGSPLVSAAATRSPSIAAEALPGLGESAVAHADSHRTGGPVHRGYVSPVPAYAISSSQPIPRGYVAHARDACVDVDYQWDSTRDSLGWGDGGELPEEWASMHQRFRRGLRSLVEWYTATDHPGEMVTKTPAAARPNATPAATTDGHHEGSAVVAAGGHEDDEEYEVENVVILVSHGAGCNALVGAITQQPVLADVAMSSLTMAERRPEFSDNAHDADYDRPLSSLEDGLARRHHDHHNRQPSDLFELKLFANTDHLLSPSLPGSRGMAVGRSASVAGPHGASGGLLVRASVAAAGSGSPIPSALRDIGFGSGAESRRNSANASLGSIRRGPQQIPSPALQPVNHTRPSIGSVGGVTVGSGTTTGLLTHRPSRSGSVGLWQPPQALHAPDPEPDSAAVDAPMLLNFSHEKEAAAAVAAVESEKKETAEAPAPPKKQEEKTQEQQPEQDATSASPSATNTNAANGGSETKKGSPRSHLQPQYSNNAILEEEEEEHDSFDISGGSGKSSGSKRVADGGTSTVAHLWAGTGNGGLWGAPRPPGEAERLRDFSAAKRRWTVTER